MGLVHSRREAAAPQEPCSRREQGPGGSEGAANAGAAGGGEAAVPPSVGPRRKKQLRDVILQLQGVVERSKAQLMQETAKRDKALATGALLRAVYGITGCLERLRAPGATPESDADALAGIEEQAGAVLAAVLAAGGATTLGPRRRCRGRGRGRGLAPRVPLWSGVDAPFAPARPFLERFLTMRGSPADKAAFVARFNELADEAEAAVGRYMERFRAGGRHDEDPALDARIVELAVDLEAPLVGLLFFHGKTMFEVFTSRMDTGEPGICPQELWDERVADLIPPTDGQDLFMEAAHDWWGRETERLMQRRRELGQRALVSPEDHEVQDAVATQLDAANTSWVTRKVAGALLCHLSIYNAVQVLAFATGVRPHWATLTGVLEAMHRRRLRLRAAGPEQAQGPPPAGAGAAGAEVKEERVSDGSVEPLPREDPRPEESPADDPNSGQGQ